jgi:hypothetical protein
MKQQEKNSTRKPIKTTLPSGEKISMAPPSELQENKIESLEGKILHPSLDMRDDFLVLGFRYRASMEGEKNIFLIMKNRAIMLTDKISIEIDQNGIKEMYFLEIRKRKLMRIEERWSLKDLQKFVEDFPTANSTVPAPNEIADKMVNLAKKYLDLEKETDYSLLSAWVIGTYFAPVFSAYPFLNVKAPKGSGKSQCLNFLRQVCFNAIKSRATVAALGDTVDALRGTYLIDQADSLGKKDGDDLLDILADSYKKSGGKRRVMNMGNGSREILEFETYGPKALASIRELPEDLRDRCLIIPLIRSQKNFYDPDDNNENWQEIRGMIYKFLVDNFSQVGSFYQIGKMEYKENSETVGRKLELWLPLETIFKMLGWSNKIEEAKERFFAWYGFAEYEPSEIEEAVMRAVLEQLMEKENITLSPKEIAESVDFSDREVFSGLIYEKQKAAKVGWAIKKFNLSSEKLKQTKRGVSYLFEKKKVANIYSSYFGKKPTLPTSEQENVVNIEDIGI